MRASVPAGFAALWLLANPALAQGPPFNSSLVGQISPGSPDYADVWGDGQFAYVGRFFQNGIDVVDLTTPSSPSVEANYTIPSPNTGASAQDLKVLDINGDTLLFIGMEFNDPHGVQVVDIRTPSSPTLLTNIDTEPGAFEQIHNIFVADDFLYMDNSADNTISILDLRTYDADSPPATIDAWTWRLDNVGGQFVHDVTVQHDRLYASAWDSLVVYDTSSVETQAPTFLGSTPGMSTHAAWATDDGEFVVTSEERAGGGLRLYEIVDNGGSIDLLPRDSHVQPTSDAFSVHNPLIVGNRIYTSWYQSGGLVHEIDRTSKTMEVVASYDTSSITPTGFNGNWGMYPYLGEDKVLLSDIENGLYVVDFSALEITFPSARPTTVTANQPNAITVAVEELGNSTLLAGTVTLHVEVEGGATQNIVMSPIGGGSYQASFPAAACGSQIEYWISATDTAARTFNDPAVPAQRKHVTYAAYGLDTVFEDDFSTNMGWTVQNQSLAAGAWERGDPRGTPAQPEEGDPDGSVSCYFTDQGSVGGSVGEADVDGGPTTLLSPVMDFSAGDGLIHYSWWLFNDDADADSLTVQVRNGGSWTTVTSYAEKSGGWLKAGFRVSDFVTPNASIQVRFQVSDNPNDSITEAAVDEVRAETFDCVAPDPGIRKKRFTGGP